MRTGSARQVQTLTCRICGTVLAGAAEGLASDGFCATCHHELVDPTDVIALGELSPAQPDDESTPALPPTSDRAEPLATPVFPCSVCGRTFLASGVYEAAGRVICHACFAKAADAAARSAGLVDVAAPATAFPAAATPPQNSAAATRTPPRAQIRTLVRVTCPHCWHRFAPEDILWVSEHVDLLGDQVLGPEAQVRFLPTRFTVDGHALDARGTPCQRLACPHCHLSVPRPLVEIEPLFVSIVGVPSSGKSYLLASMTWELRRILPAKFAVSFNDADPLSNRSLNEYEETLFLNHDRDAVVALRKTELQGELYDQIRQGQQVVSLPRPFIFSVRPRSRHANAENAQNVSRAICLYDNAGEHFQPGMDSSASPVTQHLARSRVMMFVYDPTQDPRFRERCRAVSRDPQLADTARTQRQETILTEAALRVRRYAGLTSGQKHDRPLIVLVSKSDAWGSLIDEDLSKEPFVENALNGEIAAIDTTRVEAVSAKVRALMLELAPEFVGAAEDFSQYVIYIPVSALGRAPEIEPGSKLLGIRPRDIKPRWVTVPLLYTFAKWSSGLIGRLVPTPA